MNDLQTDFLKLVDRYGGLIAKVCYFYSVDADDFNDLRQEALLNLWKGFPSYRGEAAPQTWIYRVTLNSCVSYFRRHKRRSSAASSIDTVPELIADGADRATLLRELYSLICRLDKTDMALILLWLDEYSYEAIADITGMPRNTVASRLRRIKEKLVEYSQNS